MKKTIAFLLFVLLLSYAQGIILNGYDHSNDYYAVSFDGEGDAMVRTRLTIVNPNEQPLNNITLEFPGRNIVFYDFIEESDGRISRIKDPVETAGSESTTIRLNLRYAIHEGKSGTIVAVYRIPRLGKNILGAFYYDFKTAIDPSARNVENVRVAINVQEGFKLAGEKADVDYREDYFSMEKQVAYRADLEESSNYQSFSRGISESKGIVKTAADLDPMESFSVKGQYSKSYLRLHLIGSIVTTLILAMILFFIYSNSKKIKIKKDQFKLKKLNYSMPVSIIVTSLLQAVIMAVIWFLCSILLKNLGKIGNTDFVVALAIAAVLLSALTIIGIFLIPPIWFGVKKGIFEGILVFVLTIVWLILIVIISLFVIAYFSGGRIFY